MNRIKFYETGIKWDQTPPYVDAILKCAKIILDDLILRTGYATMYDVYRILEIPFSADQAQELIKIAWVRGDNNEINMYDLVDIID